VAEITGKANIELMI